jgi:hypothetical protein
MGDTMNKKELIEIVDRNGNPTGEILEKKSHTIEIYYIKR